MTVKYHEIPEDEKWRVSVVNEITDTKFGLTEIALFSADELEEILRLACIS